MLPLTQLLSSHVPSSSLLLTTPIPKPSSAALVSHHKPTIPTGSAKRLSFGLQLGRNKYTPLKCSAVSLVSDPPQLELAKPLPAEVSRTIMELSSVATLSTLTQQGGWPLGRGVRFAVDRSGVPVLCLNEFNTALFADNRCSLHVQLEQSGVRTPQCTILGSLEKPSDRMVLRRLYSAWNKRFNEEVDESLLYVINVERLLQIEDFAEDGVWVSSSEYASAEPDPLRECAGKIVDEINTHNVEDVYRFCNIYVDLDFQIVREFGKRCVKLLLPPSWEKLPIQQKSNGKLVL